MTNTRGTSLTAFDGFPAFTARAPWWGADLQTVRNTLLRPRFRLDAFPAEDLRFAMEDGSGDVLTGVLNRPADGATGQPLVLLVHGLTGSAESPYMRASAYALLRQGYAVLRLNLRGAGASRPLCRNMYHAGRTEDLRRVLAGLPPALAENGVVLAGYSLGGNVVLKLLGEGVPGLVRGGAGISAPLDLRKTSLRLMAPRNFLYHRWILRGMKAEALAGPLEPGEADIVRSARSCWQFDDRFVAPRNGWRDAEEYYAVNSAKRYLDSIAVPTLLIHALDDPWIPSSIYTGHDWAANPNLRPLLPARGGHVGFHGAAGAVLWHDQCLLRFLERIGS